MKIENLVLSIDQMQHLKELGVEVKDTALAWAVGEMSFKDVTVKHQSVVAMDSNPTKYGFIKDVIPTLSLQEILEMLPKKIENTRHEIFCLDFYYDSISYIDYDGCLIIRFDLFPSPLQSLYNILCWVAENGYLNKE